MSDRRLYEITKSEDILPGSLLIIDEKVSMLLTDLHSSDTCSFESCFIDELTCREGELLIIHTELWIDPEGSWCEFWIFEKTATRYPCRLFYFSDCLDITRREMTVFFILEWRDIEEHRYDKFFLIALQYAPTIDVLYIFSRIGLDMS